MLANAQCDDRGTEGRSAGLLLRQLLIGIRDRATIEQEEVSLNGQRAVRRVLDGRVSGDGAPTRIEAYVLSEGRCVYDFVYVAPPASFDTWRGEFRAFVESFAMERDRVVDAYLRRTVIWYGGVGLLTGQVARSLALPPKYFRLVVHEIEVMGVQSLGVALTAAIFTGMVFTIQSAVNMARFGAEMYVGPLTSLAILRELGPVLTAILVGGKVASGITAELGLDEGDRADRRPPDPGRELHQAPRRPAGPGGADRVPAADGARRRGRHARAAWSSCSSSAAPTCTPTGT